MARRWYVIRTKPQCDYLAAGALRRDGFEMFFPLVTMPLRRAGRTDYPLFPGYLFLRYDAEVQDWPAVRQLPGILGWVRFNGEVPPVPDEVVSDLAERVAAINRTGGLWTRFRRGEKVRVVSGEIESLAEVLDEPTCPESRVRVLMEFMGRLVPALVPSSTLSRVEEGAGANRSGARRTRGRGRWVRGFGPRAFASV